MRKQYRKAGRNAPTGIDLPFDTEIRKMVEVVDLIAIDLPLLLFDSPHEVPERRLISIAEADRPKFGILMVCASASV